MQRLLQSSKFWVTVLGGIALFFVYIVLPEVRDVLEGWLVAYPALGAILVTVGNVLEDMVANWKSGDVDTPVELGDAFRESMQELIQEIIDRILPGGQG